MDVIGLNEIAWNRIGTTLSSPYLATEVFARAFDVFCEALPPAAAVLDLGCGTGLPCTRELVDRGFSVTAVDISENMILAARKNVPEAKCFRKSMTEITFDAEFDGVCSSYSMISLDLPNFSKCAANVVSSLKSRGLFFVAVNEPKDGRRALEEACYQELSGVAIYVRPYTEAEIREVFEPLGMKVEGVERELVHSAEYGVEHMLLMRMSKR